MPNYDPSKLQSFLTNTPDLSPQGISSLLALKRENEEKEKIIKEQQEQMGLIPESQPLVGRFALLENKYERVKLDLEDKDTIKNLEERAEELKDDLKNISNNLTRESLDEISTKLSSFEMLLSVAEQTIHPPTPEPLDIYSGWPSSIYKKNTKGRKGWVFKDSNGVEEELPNDSEWDKADANIGPVFDEFVRFFTKGSVSEQTKRQEEGESLVELKNQITQALLNKDLNRARGLARTLKLSISEREEAAQKIEKDRAAERSEDGAWRAYYAEVGNLNKKLSYLSLVLDKVDVAVLRSELNALYEARKLLSAHNIELKKGKEVEPRPELQAEYDQLLKEIKQNFSELEAKHREALPGIIKEAKLKEIKQREESLRRQKRQEIQNKVDASLHEFDINNYSDKDKKVIFVAGEKDPLSPTEYKARMDAKQPQTSKITITDEMEDAWPELKAAGYGAGKIVDKKWFGEFEHRTTYKRQYLRDKNAFLKRFTIPVLDQKTNKVRYVASPLFKAQSRTWTDGKVIMENGKPTGKMSGETHLGTQDVIRDILAGDDIVIVEQNDEERKVEAKKEELDKELWRVKNSVSFHPRLKKTKVFGITVQEGKEIDSETSYRLGGLDPKEMDNKEKMVYSVGSLVEKYDNLKKRREKYLAGAVNYRFAEMERDLDEKQAAAEKEKEELKGNTNWSVKLGFNKLPDFQKALEKYEKEITPLIEAQKAERKIPADPLEKQKRQEALKKIEEILNTRQENIKKKGVLIKGGRKWMILATAVLAGATASQLQKKMQEQDIEDALAQTPIVKTVPQPTKIENPGQLKSSDAQMEKIENGLDLVNDKELLRLTRKGPPEDQDVIRETVRSLLAGLIDPKNPSSIEAILDMEGYKALREPGYGGLTPEKQAMLSQFIVNLQDISQKVNYTERLSLLRRGQAYNHPSNWFITPNVTLRDYLIEIRKKVQAPK